MMSLTKIAIKNIKMRCLFNLYLNGLFLVFIVIIRRIFKLLIENTNNYHVQISSYLYNNKL